MSDIKFEDALKKLEEIVENLESGEFGLDESLKKYEEGIKLIALCREKIENAKKKVEILIKTKDGKVKLEDFEKEEGPKKIKPIPRRQKRSGETLF